ncbi:MAG: HlyD family efflux transporter periplasmic adaptor subunit [Congregibacter sp.]
MILRWPREWIFVAFTCVTAGCSESSTDAPLVGYVEADWIIIAASEAGWVESLYVDEGDSVEIDTLLFDLDAVSQESEVKSALAVVRQSQATAANIESGARAPEIKLLEAKKDEAMARLAKSRADYERLRPLLESGVEPASRGDSTRAELDVALASVKAIEQDIAVARLAARPQEVRAAQEAISQAKAALAVAQYRLDQRRQRSPTRGVVNEVLLREGEFATAGAAVLAVQATDSLRVKFFVPQAGLAQLEVGATVTVKVDGAAEGVAANIRFIASDPEFTPPVIYSKDQREKLVFLVEAQLSPGTTLKPGLPVDVTL